MHKRELRVLYLPRSSFSSKLCDRFDDMKQTTGRTWVSVGKEAAMRIARNRAISLQRTAHDRGSSGTALKKSDRFELNKKCDCERIVNLSDVDVTDIYARRIERVFR